MTRPLYPRRLHTCKPLSNLRKLATLNELGRVGVLLRILLLSIVLLWPIAATAQQNPLTVATVTRPPFSMIQDGAQTGFSIELFDLLAAELNRDVAYTRTDSFGEMLDLVTSGQVDGAIANISITSARETEMAFTQPIFESGIAILLPGSAQSPSIFSTLFTQEILFAILAAIALLFGGGMLMWIFERRAQPYFDRTAKDAAFPAFWWALNLVVNGGFEERMPQSRPGRIFAVILVVASLFIVSIFVAKITAALTVAELQNNVTSLADLEGRPVGTVASSTSSGFLDDVGIAHQSYPDLETLLTAFEAGGLDALVFDRPILAYYANTRGRGTSRLVDRTFKPENYGMALPTGSPLRETLDQALLRLREDGTYARLRIKWFGSN